MKTYSVEILREVFFKLIDTDKFVKFTVFNSKGRPYKLKAKVSGLWADSKGLSISFYKAYWNRKKFLDCCVNVRDIQWVDNPFNDRFEQLCEIAHLARGSQNYLASNCVSTEEMRSGCAYNFLEGE